MTIKKQIRSDKNGVKEPDQPLARSSFSPKGMRNFFYEVQTEFKKIVWPTKKGTVGLTGLVLVLVFVLALYLGSIDLFLGKLVTMVLK